MPLYFSPSSGRTLVKSLNATTATVANTETVVLQYLIPAGSWLTGTAYELDKLVALKSGTTDTGTIKIRIGTAGTTADTSIMSVAALSTATRQWRGDASIRLESATTVLPSGGTSGGFLQGNAAGALAAITISNVSNALYLSVTLASSSTNDTVALAMGSIWMVDRIG